MPRPRSDSRERLVAAAGRLIRRHGYQATGMAQIIEASGAPRGSVYFLFPGGKEELAVDALRASAREWSDVIRAASAEEPDPAAFFRRLARELSDDLRESGYREGCPVSTVTLDSVPDSPVLAAVCQQTYLDWRRALVDALERYRVPAARRDGLATLILAAVEGALVLSRAAASTDPLETVRDEITALVTAAVPGWAGRSDPAQPGDWELLKGWTCR